MNVENRKNIGSNKVNKLRTENLLPGVVYKRGEETLHVQVSEAEFFRIFKLAGTTNIINMELEGKSHPVIIKDIQRHPVKNNIIHIDFQELNMNEKIKMTIPIHLLNRDNIKLQPSILSQVLDQVEIECLPDDIPHFATIDVEDLNYNEPKYVKDLDIVQNKSVTILTDLNILVCTLSEPIINDDNEADAEETNKVEKPEE